MKTRLYCVTSRTTGKMYVGITSLSVAKRWKTHVYNARRNPGAHNKFHRAILKYGPDDFEVIELHRYATEEETLHAEVSLIASLNLMVEGYNSATGGYGSHMPAGMRRASPRSRENHRAAAHRRAADPVWIEKMREVARRRSADPLYRARLSQALTGKTLSDETKEKLSKYNTGRKHSEETRQKMSASQKRRWQSECRQ